MGTHIIAAVTTYCSREHESPPLYWLLSLIFSNKKVSVHRDSLIY